MLSSAKFRNMFIQQPENDDEAIDHPKKLDAAEKKEVKLHEMASV